MYSPTVNGGVRILEGLGFRIIEGFYSGFIELRVRRLKGFQGYREFGVLWVLRFSIF